MNRIALLVGINRYESEAFGDLVCCVDDALAMQTMLSRHAAMPGEARGQRNYHCHTLTSEAGSVRADDLRQAVDRLMSQFMDGGEVLFYFSGHGLATEDGGYLVTQDGAPEAPGYPMGELLRAANHSRNLSIVIILDCCHSGELGNLTDSEGFNQASIGPNVTVLAASGAVQKSAEGLEHSRFTELVLEALDGGAADVCGTVSAAGVYAYAESALGPWEQRPVYKSYARRLGAIRRCPPAVGNEVLARLPEWFPFPAAEYSLSPAHECSHPLADPACVEVFDHFKVLRNAHLLATSDGRDLYWTALESGTARLTPQGRLFWLRAQRGDF